MGDSNLPQIRSPGDDREAKLVNQYIDVIQQKADCNSVFPALDFSGSLFF